MQTTIASVLLDELRSRGFTVTANGTDLFVSPRAKLGQADVRRIIEGKRGLLEALRQEDNREAAQFLRACRAKANAKTSPSSS